MSARSLDHVELHESRTEVIGAMPVRRALPWHGRRTVGAWCFVDHMGPVSPEQADALQIGPHPHIGLQTVTWLLEGELVHTDSLGSEQPIRPGQLNLMTAARGIAHGEAGDRRARGGHGAQLWVAMPDETRHGPPAFEHHAELPVVDLDGVVATVLLGELAGTRSPARADTPIVGADLVLLPGRVVLPLEPMWEHALVVLEGEVHVAGDVITPGVLAYQGAGAEELVVDAGERARFLLLGGEPFPWKPVIWWNFVGRDRDEVAEARADWMSGDGGRFAAVESALPRVPAPDVPW